MLSETTVEAVTSVKTDSIMNGDFVRIFEIFRATVLIRKFFFRRFLNWLLWDHSYEKKIFLLQKYGFLKKGIYKSA